MAQLQVASSVGSNGSTLTLANIKAPKNGYAYVYVSNQSNNDVYFDNMQVQVAAGNIIEENHFYAYGLRIATLSSRKLADTYEGNLKNNYLYNGNEIFDDADLNWYDFGFRNYDPQIGRFLQIDPLSFSYPFFSPYAYGACDPINYFDPNGLEPMPAIVRNLVNRLNDIGGYATAKIIGGAGKWAGMWSVSWSVGGQGFAFAFKASRFPTIAVGKAIGIVLRQGYLLPINNIIERPKIDQVGAGAITQSGIEKKSSYDSNLAAAAVRGQSVSPCNCPDWDHGYVKQEMNDDNDPAIRMIRNWRKEQIEERAGNFFLVSSTLKTGYYLFNGFGNEAWQSAKGAGVEWGTAYFGGMIVEEFYAGVTAKTGIQANQAAGNAFRDELGDLLTKEGRGVAFEVYKKTPFGPRIIDIEVSLTPGGRVLGGIEAKVGNSHYKVLQRLKDLYLNKVQGYPVNLVRKPPNW